MKTIIKLAVCLLIAGLVYRFAFYKTPQQKMFAKTLAAAQAGDMNAALSVGKLYAAGEGTAQNGTQAAEWYRKAAVDGSSEASWLLAQLYITGVLVPQDLEEALTYLQLSARAGYAASQSELGRFYEQGLAGLPVHPAQALYWRFLAAQNGDKKAQALVQQTEKENPELFLQIQNFLDALALAKQGNAASRLEAGRAYRTGFPILRDDEQAVFWLTAAWEENQSAEAACELAELYQNGWGVEKSEAKALELLGAAAEKKSPLAQYLLGERSYKENPPKYEDAFAWFSNAAEGGYPQAQYMTGFMLMQGQGTPRSVPLAINFFRDAAEKEHTAAQYVLGQIYWKGLGVPVDKKAGEKWLLRAAQNGNASAKALLEN